MLKMVYYVCWYNYCGVVQRSGWHVSREDAEADKRYHETRYPYAGGYWIERDYIYRYE